MTEADINFYIKKFDKLVAELPKKREKQVQDLVTKIGDRYFTSPASGSKQKHDAEPGGLLSHSISVVENLKVIRGVWFPDIPMDSVIIGGLFHDLGKIGDFAGHEYYSPTAEDWQRRKGILYERNKALKDGLTHAQRSVRLLQQCGVELTDDEHVAIIYHDGLYVKENAQLSYIHGNALVMALHWADYYTAFFDTERK